MNYPAICITIDDWSDPFKVDCLEDPFYYRRSIYKKISNMVYCDCNGDLYQATGKIEPFCGMTKLLFYLGGRFQAEIVLSKLEKKMDFEMLKEYAIAGTLAINIYDTNEKERIVASLMRSRSWSEIIQHFVADYEVPD